jgi:hypothetical protein
LLVAAGTRRAAMPIGGSCFRRSDPAGIGRGEWSGRAGDACR